jgi:hypothetical protein
MLKDQIFGGKLVYSFIFAIQALTLSLQARSAELDNSGTSFIGGKGR